MRSSNQDAVGLIENTDTASQDTRGYGMVCGMDSLCGGQVERDRYRLGKHHLDCVRKCCTQKWSMQTHLLREVLVVEHGWYARRTQDFTLGWEEQLRMG